jgi:NlpC/P60 family/Bacterial dipeptidyl-peptidase Sh3 domain
MPPLRLRCALVYGAATMPNTRRNFSLTSHSIALDMRVHAVRGDLADVTLADRLFAPHYAEALARSCVVPYVAVCDVPDGEQISELLEGENFMLLDVSGGWAWGFCALDHYVGYIPADVLGDAAPPRVERPQSDAATAAEQFLGMTYVYGGRGGSGIDCSGLIQRSLEASGIAAWRDSDMQEATLGEVLPDNADLRRGDLMFFPEHVGMMIDGERMIHATRHANAVVIEPLADVIARIGKKHAKPVNMRKRIVQ